MAGDSSPAAPALAADALTRRFGEHVAVDGVSFTVARGEIFGLLGPNGAGKSTTVRMLTGYLAPTAGRAQVEGIDVCVEPSRARRHIGVVPEEANVYADLSARLIRDRVARLNCERGMTALLTTHNMAEAEALCHRVGILREGRLVAIDTPAALRRRVAARRSVAVTFAGSVPDPAEVLPSSNLELVRVQSGWRVYAPEPGPLAQQIAVRCAALGLELAGLNTLEPSLEDVFVAITGPADAPH